MSVSPFVGEIMPWAGNFAPDGWAFCDGSEMSISQNTALFSLLGTTYGGDGKNTFGLPDLRGRAPMHFGTGPGLTPRVLGAHGRAETVALTADHLPSHNHPLRASSDAGSTASPGSAVYARRGAYAPAADGSVMDAEAVAPAGGGAEHPNMQPFLVITYVIALEGVFPPRS